MRKVMPKQFECAAQEAGRRAAHESFKVYGHAVLVAVAWCFINESLQAADPELYDALPREMPDAFYHEYCRVAAELSKAAA
jgi:hypothetical protein